MFRTLLVGLALVAAALSSHAQAGIAPAASVQALPDLEQADPKMKKALESSRSITLQLPGFSQHFTKAPCYKQPCRDYNERHWGIGVQVEDPLTGNWDGWVRKTAAGLMKDSLDAMGLYSSLTYQKRIVDGPTLSVDVGAGAFLFWRTLEWDGPHRLVPGVLPVFSVKHKPTELGANLVIVPEVKFSTNRKLPGVAYLQFTKDF